MSLTLHPHPLAASAARRFVASIAQDILDEQRTNDLEVMVSEIVSNGIVHAATTMELVISTDHDSVRVELVDEGPGAPLVRNDPGPDGGYGLRIVAALARRWGVEPHAGGKTVWLEI